jgi:hypothetical protein
MKICSNCKIEKDKSEFSQDRSKKDGLCHKCKGCVKKYNKEYNSKSENKIRRQERERESRSTPAYKQYIKKYHKKYYSIPKNNNHRREYNREYGKVYRSIPENKEHRKVYDKEYRSIPKNKEHIKEYQNQYYSKPENKEYRKQRQKKTDKEYHKNHPDIISRNKARRRSLEVRASTIEFTKEQYFDRMSMFNFQCAYCGGPWEHDDHVIPLSRGGLHILANLRPSCAHCNCSKGNKLLSEWERIRNTK